jgi:hypothetical protein
MSTASLPSPAAGSASTTASPAASGGLATSATPGVVPVATLTPQAASSAASTTSTVAGTPQAQHSQQNMVHQRNGETIYNSMEKIVSERGTGDD